MALGSACCAGGRSGRVWHQCKTGSSRVAGGWVYVQLAQEQGQRVARRRFWVWVYVLAQEQGQRVARRRFWLGRRGYSQPLGGIGTPQVELVSSLWLRGRVDPPQREV